MGAINFKIYVNLEESSSKKDEDSPKILRQEAPSYRNRATEVILPYPVPPVRDDWAMKAAEQLDQARCLLRLFFFSLQIGQITKAIVDKKNQRRGNEESRLLNMQGAGSG